MGSRDGISNAALATTYASVRRPASTRALASVWAESPVEIVAVVDDNYSLNGRRLWGWPIVLPDAAGETGAKSVVISSWMHESEIHDRHAALLASTGLSVFTLYSATPQTLTPQPV